MTPNGEVEGPPTSARQAPRILSCRVRGVKTPTVHGPLQRVSDGRVAVLPGNCAIETEAAVCAHGR